MNTQCHKGEMNEFATDTELTVGGGQKAFIQSASFNLKPHMQSYQVWLTSTFVANC